MIDREQLRLDFRDAARFWAWSEAEKVEIGAAVGLAIQGNDEELQRLWADWLASYAEAWRRLAARLPRPSTVDQRRAA